MSSAKRKRQRQRRGEARQANDAAVARARAERQARPPVARAARIIARGGSESEWVSGMKAAGEAHLPALGHGIARGATLELDADRAVGFVRSQIDADYLGEWAEAMGVDRGDPDALAAMIVANYVAGELEKLVQAELLRLEEAALQAALRAIQARKAAGGAA